MAPPWRPPPLPLKYLSDEANFVVMYELPGNHRGRGTHFVLSHGNVPFIDDAAATKMIAELQSGQNPPPSLPAALR